MNDDRPATDRPLVATYRIQLRGGLDLDAAAGWLDHLAALGVSHAYLSPVLEATADSTHGYDVVDPRRADPALGGDVALARFAARAHDRGLGVILDIVPNHMAGQPDQNPWWRDVLRHGRASRYAGHFDITWDPPDRKLRDVVLLPVLGDHYGRILDRGELVVEPDGDGLAVRYFERTFPIAPDSIRDGDDGTGTAGDVARYAEDLDALHELLDAQHYRLARWQTGSEEVDYRRFFDITELVGVRVERPEVFADTHERIAAWLDAGLLDGLRVDHPDGLADPAAYCGRLRDVAGDRWIVVEKILETGEALPDWPVDGTVGYEVAAAINRLFVSPAGYAALQRELAPATAGEEDPGVVIRAAKGEVLDAELAAELRRLTDRLVAVCEEQPRYRDFTRHELRIALATALACLPVYRTYVDAEGRASTQDRAVLARMVQDARDERPELDGDLWTLIVGALLGEPPFTGPAEVAFRQRFQQLSGAAMAKGKEDTALYRYAVLLSVNEVGADPAHPALDAHAFHALCEARAASHPRAMSTLSTHDTKRSDDVRARLDVLAEEPAALRRALDIFDPHGEEPLLVSTLVQALVGAHPLPEDRAQQYIVKAMREAGVHTSWLHPDEAYEANARSVVASAYTDPARRKAVADLAAAVLVDGRVNALAQRLLLLTVPGVPDLYQGSELWDLSLVDPDNRRPVDVERARRLLAAGGWVDPETAVPGWVALEDHDDPGSPKLALTVRALAVRRAHQRAFGRDGTYDPLVGHGRAAEHVVAFARGGEVVVVVPRLGRSVRAQGGWSDTAIGLPEGGWRDALVPGRTFHGGESVRIGDLFAPFPVALLERAPS